MAGKLGMKGCGGARPGSGRKPKPAPVMPNSIISVERDSPQAFLLELMNDAKADARMRVDAAKALLPFMHPKLGEGGKKDERANAAKKAGVGEFAAAPPPLRLVR